MEIVRIEDPNHNPEHEEMFRLQIEIMDEIMVDLRKKIPTLVYWFSGDTIGISVPIGNPEKSTVEFKYNRTFNRKIHLTTDRKKMRDWLFSFIRVAFSDRSGWHINSFERLNV